MGTTVTPSWLRVRVVDAGCCTVVRNRMGLFCLNPTPTWLTRIRHRRTDTSRSSPHYTLQIEYRQVHKREVGAGSSFYPLSSVTNQPHQVSLCHPDANQTGGYTRSKLQNRHFISHADLLMLGVSFHSELEPLGYGDALW